jgi:hypothetical protein
MTEAPEELEGGFSRRIVNWVVGIALASFVAAILLSAFGEDLQRRPTPGPNTFSDSALGHRALAEFLRSAGLGVASRQSPAGGTGPTRPLILAEPDAARQLHRIEGLREEAAAREAPLVVVLPKWKGEPRKGKPEWLDKVAFLPERELRKVLEAIDPELKAVGFSRQGRTSRCVAVWAGGGPALAVEAAPAQLLLPNALLLEPVVQCGGGLLVARRNLTSEGPELFLIADPDVLNNHGLGRGDNAVLVHRLLVERIGASGVVFDETIHGFNRTPGLLAEALRFPLVLAVLQALVLAGAVLWAGMGRFGKPLPAAAGLAAGKELLIDNTAKLLANGGHAADSLARYFRQTTRAVAAHYFLPHDLPDGEVLARLQRITDGRGVRIDLAAQERRLQSLPEGRGAGERAARIARRLHQWRLEMTHGNRQGP